jgi:putative protease
MIKADRNDIEIMAPAGSFESLTAAIQAGADSVYFGAGELNMRARSSYNFSIPDLRKAVKAAARHKVKTYLALNTIVYDKELSSIRKIITEAREAGITAIIASDQAVISEARRQAVEVHLSTQLNISNIESLRFYAAYADVVVLARELTLSQIRDITRQIEKDNITGPSGKPVRIELFVHGALCMAISGKCYLSLHQYNHSANRGDCLQACRRPYLVREKETGKELEIDNEFIMSPKDLSTITMLDKIVDTGVQVLKIEGRGRPAEYVKTVTTCYREAAEAVFSGLYTKPNIEKWQAQLTAVYNRGFWDGFYLGESPGEWSNTYGSRASKKKIYLGKGMNYFRKIRVAHFLIENDSMMPGDEILITGPSTGVIQTRVREIKIDDRTVLKAKKGDNISIPIDQIIRRSDKLYKLVDRDD